MEIPLLLNTKEFLNFREMAEFINANGYNYDIYNSYDRTELTEYLKGMIFEKRLTPVYFFNGVFKECYLTAIEGDLTNIEINNARLKRYFIIVGDELLNAIFRDTETTYSINMGHCIPYEQNIVFECGKPMYKDWYFDDESGFITAYDIVYPKKEIFALFENQADQTAQLQAQIDRLTAENQQQADTIQQLNERLEAGTPAEPIGDNLLSVIMDSTKDSYAPDLAHAIKLWLDLYHYNPKDSDSHTNRAKNWLNKNTGYDEFQDKQSFNRIREIATPLKDFGTQRSRENKK